MQAPWSDYVMSGVPVNLVEETDRIGRYGVSAFSGRITGPVVFCEGGLAAPVEIWSAVVDQLLGRVDTVVTERRNTFRSARVRGPRTVPVLAEELLQSMATRTPDRDVILVAEGFGGLVALEAARRDTTGQVTGLVLIDSLHPAALKRSARQRQAMARLEAAMARNILKSRLGGGPADEFSLLPVEAGRRAARALHAAPWTHCTALRELQGWKRAAPTPVESLAPAVRLCVLSSADILSGDPSQGPLQEALSEFVVISRTAVVQGGPPLLSDAGVDAVATEILAIASTEFRGVEPEASQEEHRPANGAEHGSGARSAARNKGMA